MHRSYQDADRGQARPEAHFNVLRGAFEPTHRMHNRRFTRLTNGFSKKFENHAYSVALFAMYYNFVKQHSTLRMSPAMAAGVSKTLWEIGDIVKLVEAAEGQPAKRGTYGSRLNEGPQS
jgi:hypothetical protein